MASRKVAHRGPYCVQSDEAVSLLNRHGFDARRLEVGLPDWRANGLPVVIANQKLKGDRGFVGRSVKPWTTLQLS